MINLEAELTFEQLSEYLADAHPGWKLFEVKFGEMVSHYKLDRGPGKEVISDNLNMIRMFIIGHNDAKREKIEQIDHVRHGKQVDKDYAERQRKSMICRMAGNIAGGISANPAYEPMTDGKRVAEQAVHIALMIIRDVHGD